MGPGVGYMERSAEPSDAKSFYYQTFNTVVDTASCRMTLPRYQKHRMFFAVEFSYYYGIFFPNYILISLTEL